MKLGGYDCAPEGIELAEQTCEVSYRQEMPVVFVEGREDFALRTLRSFSRGARNCIFFELTWVPRNSCDRRGTSLHFSGWTEKPR